MSEGSDKMQAYERFERHRAAIEKNPNGWRKGKTSRKRRLAKGQPAPPLIEKLASDVYGEAPQRETSKRGDNRRRRRAEANALVSEDRPLHHMHSHARRMTLLKRAIEARQSAA